MASLSYRDDLYSSFLGKVTDYNFVNMSEDDVYELMFGYFKSAISQPYVRRLFSSVKMDDEIMEMTFTLKDSVDEDSDKYFIIEVLSRGMVIAWLEPQVKSTVNLSQMYGGKEQKFYSQAQQLSELKDLLSTTKSEQRRIICDHGYVNNSYLRGE
jgi:hypothetical protein